MKDGLFLTCLLFLEFYLQVKCDISADINEESQNCTFILSNGDYEEFLSAFPLFEKCTKQFKKATLWIKLVNYSLPAFPNGTFANLPYLKNFKLEISNGSQIQILSPLLPQYSVFKNMRFEYAMFGIKDSASLSGWKWEALSEIEYEGIKQFDFVAMRSKIIRLAPSFQKIAGGKLTTIRIINCQLRWLSKNVFGPFSSLISLELQKNFIENFERFHLPEDASKLRFLDLGKNRLQYISWDLFTDLKLEKLFLSGNNIKILNNEIHNIMAANSLSYVYGVLWPCDDSKLQELFKKIKNLLEEDCYTSENTIRRITAFI